MLRGQAGETNRWKPVQTVMSRVAVAVPKKGFLNKALF